jgi:hypothetical protein
MSSGCRHLSLNAKQPADLSKLLANSNLRSLLAAIPQVDNSYDLPALSGYSRDGRTIYIDRDLPEKIMVGEREIEIKPLLTTHERLEKSLMNAMGYDYPLAHQYATMAEHALLRSKGNTPDEYDEFMSQFIKAKQFDKLIRIPPDLDLTPYKNADDRALFLYLQNLARIQGSPPESVTMPPLDLAGRGWSGLSWVGLVTGLALLGAGVLASFVTIAKYVASDSSGTTAPDQGTQAASLKAPIPEASPQPTKPQRAAVTRLVAERANAENGDEISLGVRVDGPSEGITAIVRGLRSGIILSVGRPLGEGGWVVPASELARTTIRPPRGFSGTMEYTIMLQLADGTVVDQQAMRLDWAETPSAVEPRSSRELDPDEIATLLHRGQEMFETGDLAGARLLLQRAADAGDARAAFALGASYDPLVLEQIGVFGVAADVAKARAWYEKATEYGSTEAPKRLRLLTGHVR